jgi:hypothetical protein
MRDRVAAPARQLLRSLWLCANATRVSSKRKPLQRRVLPNAEPPSPRHEVGHLLLKSASMQSCISRDAVNPR